MGNAYTCIIIDDEQHAIGLLKESISDLYSNIKIVGAFTTWKEGLEALRTTKADLLFLDISIGGKNGMDLLKMLPKLESEIIFVTAYSEYAVEAFKFSATGYIVKPVGHEALSTAVNKAVERINDRNTARQAGIAQKRINTKIGIPSGKGISYFDVEDIFYFEAVNNYTRVVTKTGEIVSSYNIGKYTQLLEGMPFYHVHRSYVVNIHHVVRFETSGTIIMVNKKEIPVARSSKDDFLKLFTSIRSAAE